MYPHDRIFIGTPCDETNAEARWAQHRLRSRNPLERQGAVKRLGEIDPGCEAILGMLDDPAPAVRAEAASALGKSPAGMVARVTTRLVLAMEDPDHRVVAAVIGALGRLGAESAREPILARLDRWCAEYRETPGAFHPIGVARAAAFYIERVGPPAAAEHLLPLLAVHWESVWHLAAIVIGRLRPPGAANHVAGALERFVDQPPRLQPEFERGKAYVELLAALGAGDDESISTLTRIAQNSPGLRGHAVNALTRLAPATTAPRLERLLSDPDERLRCLVIKLMVSGGYRPALPAIRAFLRNRGVTLRGAALRAIVELGDVAAAAEIRSLCLDEPNPFLRPEAVGALASLLGVGAISTLADLVDDPNPLVRRSVAVSLGRLEERPAEATALLGQLARDENQSVATAARAALGDGPVTMGSSVSLCSASGSTRGSMG